MKSIASLILMFVLIGSARAAPEVVADSACPYYKMDIAAFATCDGDRVARTAAPQNAAQGEATRVASAGTRAAAAATSAGPVQRAAGGALRKASAGRSTGVAARVKKT